MGLSIEEKIFVNILSLTEKGKKGGKAIKPNYCIHKKELSYTLALLTKAWIQIFPVEKPKEWNSADLSASAAQMLGLASSLGVNHLSIG